MEPGESKFSVPEAAAELVVLVRNLEQLRTAVQHPFKTLYCELEDPKRYRDAVAEFRKLADPDREIFVAPPRIFKSGEEWILKIVESSEPDGVLVRNHDHLVRFSHRRCIGDFSLNVANHLAAAHYREIAKLEFLTASYDLNQEQLLALLKTSNPGWYEITLHQHMPMFHMEHCVFCAFMSKGKDYHDCGRPCEKHSVQLKDRVGALHPLKADAGCRNTLYNALAQTGAEFLPEFIRAGARRFRIEFLNESAEEVTRTLGMYQKLLEGRMTGHELWQSLKLKHQLGVTRGQMDRKDLSHTGG